MKIQLKEILVRDLVKQYTNNDEAGVSGYDGKLNIRPKYQREMVYSGKNEYKRDAVIDTVRKGFPLNTMYWIKNIDGGYEVLDGQQRALSICEYVEGNFDLNDQYFHNLEFDEQEQILDYELMVYFCEGEDSEKLDWFETINIAGEKLTRQELRNAVYTGEWLTSAKKHFSKTGCPAYGLGSKYLKGAPIRQEYLQSVIKWKNDGEIEKYMANHQHDSSANELWLYFQGVIAWVEATFPNYRKEMKGVQWGELYNKYKNLPHDPELLEAEIKDLMQDEDVSKRGGIYDYVFSKDERSLSIRGFTDKHKRVAFERQGGKCASNGKVYKIDELQADHITPWALGGPTTAANCEMLCKVEHVKKTRQDIVDIKAEKLSIDDRMREASTEFVGLEHDYFNKLKADYPNASFTTHQDICYFLKGELRKGFNRNIGNLANLAEQIKLAKHATSHKWEGDQMSKVATIMAGNIAMKQLKK